MLIVDSQVHIWNSGTPLAKHRPQTPFSAEEVLGEMDEAGVDRAILIATRWEQDSNATTLDAAQRYPDRFAVMGRISLKKPESADLLPTWLEQPGMLGVRLTLTPPETDWLRDGTADWYWPEAARYRIPTMIRVFGKPDLDHVALLAQRHPELPLIIDHLATPSLRLGNPASSKDDAAFAHLPDLLPLAKWPNIAVKATTLSANSSEPYPHRNIHRFIRQVYDSFGPERIFWGSDLSRLPGPYREAVTMFTEELPWLSEQDKALIMGEAICRWLNWRMP